MATLYGSKFTDRLVTKPPVPVPAKWFQGKVRCMQDQYVFTAAIGSGDVIKLGRLPKGAIIVDSILAFTDLDGSGGTVDVGWKAVASAEQGLDDDADGIHAAVDVTSAGGQMMVSESNNVGFQKELSYESDVEATVTGCDATSGTIKLMVFYIVE